MSEVYNGFENWRDVLCQFHDFGYGRDSEKARDAFLDSQAEPDEVLVAEYWSGSYEGDALVVFRRGDKYYTVEGGHCSCYGLEGQWNPEEYDKETFVAVVDRKLENYRSDYDGYGADTKKNWEIVKYKLGATK